MGTSFSVGSSLHGPKSSCHSLLDLLCQDLDDPSMTHVCILFLEFCSRMAKRELASNLVLFHSLKSRKKEPLGISSPTRGIPHISLATKGQPPFLPGMVISPSCFHSTWLQFTLISLQQFRDTGLLSHVTFMSSFAKIRMGVTLIFFLDSYSKISMVSLQMYSPAWNTRKHSLLCVGYY